MRIRIAGVKPVHQLCHVAREVIDIAAHVAAQGHHGALIAARRTAQAQIDTPRIERIQGAKLLGDHQRRVVRQHHAAGAEVQRLGIGGQIANQHRRRRAGDAGHVVVLGQPEAAIAALLCQLG